MVDDPILRGVDFSPTTHARVRCRVRCTPKCRPMSHAKSLPMSSTKRCCKWLNNMQWYTHKMSSFKETPWDESLIIDDLGDPYDDDINWCKTVYFMPYQPSISSGFSMSHQHAISSPYSMLILHESIPCKCSIQKFHADIPSKYSMQNPITKYITKSHHKIHHKIPW